MKELILIGYSGHGFVAADIALQLGYRLLGYCDREEKAYNPFQLPFLGPEDSETTLSRLQHVSSFIAIGDNEIRRKVFAFLERHGAPPPEKLLHPSVQVGFGVQIGPGCLLAAHSSINPMAWLGKGVICNTGSIIEHECLIEDFAHIAPGAVLAGNVHIGAGAFVGANAVVKQGVKIGSRAIIGAGAVVISDIPHHCTAVGVPARPVKLHGLE